MTDHGIVSEEVIEFLKKAGTGPINDALAMEGFEGGVMGVRPARGFEAVKIVGPAITALFGPAEPGTSKMNNFWVIREAPPGSVFVIDGKGFDGHFAGDIIGEAAKKQGIEGLVIYGGCRDIAGLRKIGMTLYCTGSAVRDKPRDFQLIAYNVPIEIGGVEVKPGDIIVTDEDGVVVVPAALLENVMDHMKNTIFKLEDDLRQAIHRDASLEEIGQIISRKSPKF